MNISVDEYVESSEELVEAAEESIDRAEAFANAASRMEEAGETASGTFDRVADAAENSREEAAERAIDAFKDAYLDAHRAYVLAEGASEFDDVRRELESSTVGEYVLGDLEVEASESAKRDSHESGFRAKQIMQGLQDQYGDALDFGGYVERVMHPDE